MAFQLTWIWGALGGVMIGTAAALLLLFNGRVMGASGIIAGLLPSRAARLPTAAATGQALFVLGLFGAPTLVALTGLADGLLETHVSDNLPLLILAGLMVGFGTRLANGCTSGHGVCGMSRLSWRSIMASATYVGAGMATVTAARLIWGL